MLLYIIKEYIWKNYRFKSFFSYKYPWKIGLMCVREDLFNSILVQWRDLSKFKNQDHYNFPKGELSFYDTQEFVRFSYFNFSRQTKYSNIFQSIFRVKNEDFRKVPEWFRDALLRGRVILYLLLGLNNITIYRA